MNSLRSAKDGNSDKARDINLGKEKGPLATSLTQPPSRTFQAQHKTSTQEMPPTT